jgi:hypothetical protein
MDSVHSDALVFFGARALGERLDNEEEQSKASAALEVDAKEFLKS